MSNQTRKYEELPVYSINTELGSDKYTASQKTRQRQKMSDGAEIYRDTDGNVYADHNGQTMQVQNNYNPYTSKNFKFDYDRGYQDQLNAIADQLQNTTYDGWKQTSGEYDALKDRYSAQGKMAMQNTVGDVSARTGGLASSYAATAGNQAYNQYMQSLEDAALALYGDEYNRKMQQFNMLQGLDETAYNRAWDDVNFKYGLLQDENTEAWKQKYFDFDKEQAAQTQSNWQADFDYRADRDEKDDAASAEEKESAKAEKAQAVAQSQVAYLLGEGVYTWEELLEKEPELIALAKEGGWTDTYMAGLVPKEDAGPFDYGREVDPPETVVTEPLEVSAEDRRMYAKARPLGLGAPSAELITQLAEAGGIWEDGDGNLHWRAGWSKDNYQRKLHGGGHIETLNDFDYLGFITSVANKQ